jgi:hypothetical protein
MGDLVVLLLIVVIFGVLVGLVALCDRIVGTAETGPAGAAEQGEEVEVVDVVR